MRPGARSISAAMASCSMRCMSSEATPWRKRPECERAVHRAGIDVDEAEARGHALGDACSCPRRRGRRSRRRCVLVGICQEIRITSGWPRTNSMLGGRGLRADTRAVPPAPEEHGVDGRGRTQPGATARARVGRGGTLLGLYEGRPLPTRSVFEPFAMPDRITFSRGRTSGWRRVPSTWSKWWRTPSGTKWPTISA